MLLVLCMVFASLVHAECPNGCSGNGDCMAKDMCNCYKNFEGNDCADRTCQFGRAFVDTPRGDLNMDQSRETPNWLLTNSQQSPEGTYEYFKPDAQGNEAHFYLECSNKGICDRSTGLCQCFDGYEGSACQRTVCPAKCSGHGTCESIRELGLKAGGTLFGLEGATGAVTYDLWDSNSTYGCRCDPWYYSPDCNKRFCKVGVDPLFLSVGTARYETFVIHAYVDTTGPMPTNSWVRLRLFDYYGESFITGQIPIVTDGPTNAAAITSALKAVPNLTFRNVFCEDVGAGPNLGGYKSARTANAMGMSVVCQYSDNPGRMRIPEVVGYYLGAVTTDVKYVFVGTTAQQGEDDEWFTVQSGMVLDATTPVDATGLVLTLSGTSPSALLSVPAATPQLIKIAQHVVLAESATATTITLAFPLKHTLVTSPSIFTTQAATGASAFGLDAYTDAPASAFAIGSDIMDLGINDPSTATVALAIGDTLFYHNAFFTIQNIYLSGSNYYAKLNKPFGGNADTGDAGAAVDTANPGTIPSPFRVRFPTDKTKLYNYVSECSGRGLCSSETGICTCFKGYSGDNCNTQNIIAL
ncbi:hypothetical protein Poli38472_005996 [Pythium oligandrum]|uniref:EGF-like domain-containing protein n=1 Tax=Pythium oligandrum TaxID=41045 RepID=A0A8K1CUK4_PYTOL|nr:hypothetical protein Poli38472_005996 [Pythium oligandrum]|eukprot:TMW68528.1 hypothetical protein Poli38472_005996 [Pythium oligandrum]